MPIRGQEIQFPFFYFFYNFNCITAYVTFKFYNMKEITIVENMLTEKQT